MISKKLYININEYSRLLRLQNKLKTEQNKNSSIQDELGFAMFFCFFVPARLLTCILSFSVADFLLSSFSVINGNVFLGGVGSFFVTFFLCVFIFNKYIPNIFDYLSRYIPISKNVKTELGENSNFYYLPILVEVYFIFEMLDATINFFIKRFKINKRLNLNNKIPLLSGKILIKYSKEILLEEKEIKNKILIVDDNIDYLFNDLKNDKKIMKFLNVESDNFSKDNEKRKNFVEAFIKNIETENKATVFHKYIKSKSLINVY